MLTGNRNRVCSWSKSSSSAGLLRQGCLRIGVISQTSYPFLTTKRSIKTWRSQQELSPSATSVKSSSRYSIRPRRPMKKHSHTYSTTWLRRTKARRLRLSVLTQLPIRPSWLNSRRCSEVQTSFTYQFYRADREWFRTSGLENRPSWSTCIRLYFDSKNKRPTSWSHLTQRLMMKVIQLRQT